MSKPVLYKTDASPPVCALLTLGDIIGLEYELKSIDFINLGHKSPEFLKINPMGTIPTIDDNGFILSDSSAIMIYLLSKYGGTFNEELYPSDVKTRAIVNQCLYFNAGVFFIRLKAIALPALFDGATEATTKQWSDIDVAYGVVEAYLKDHKFVAADQMTIADLAVGTTAASFQGIRPIDAQKYPRTAAWFANLNALPVFEKYASKCTELIRDILKSKWEQNKQL